MTIHMVGDIAYTVHADMKSHTGIYMTSRKG